MHMPLEFRCFTEKQKIVAVDPAFLPQDESWSVNRLIEFRDQVFGILDYRISTKVYGKSVGSRVASLLTHVASHV